MNSEEELNVELPTTPSTPPLSGRRWALYEALAARDLKLADMYFGAFSVLNQEGNPDRLALTSHGVRELMEKMPRYLDLPVPPEGPRLGDKVRSLVPVWEKVLSRSNWSGNDGWVGTIDEVLREFLRKARELFAWFNVERPMRRERMTRVIRGLDPSGRSLPPPIEKLHVDEWVEYHDYFNDVAHHRITPTSEDFELWLGALESFLLDRLRPRTFEDLEIIDLIIKEGEGNAQP